MADREKPMKVFLCPICHGPLLNQTYEGQFYRECRHGHGILVRDSLFVLYLGGRQAKQNLSKQERNCPGCKKLLKCSKETFYCPTCQSHWLEKPHAEAFKEWSIETQRGQESSGPLLPWIGGLSKISKKSSTSILWLAFTLLGMFFLQSHMPSLNPYTMFYPSDPLQNFGLNFFLSLLCHGSIQHLGVNLLFLIILGTLVDKHLENLGVLQIFLLSGITGNLLQVAMGISNPTLGASGGVAGLVVALALLEPNAHFTLSPQTLVKGNIILPYDLVIVLWLIIEFRGLYRPEAGTNHWAHLTGAIVGFLCIQLSLVSKATDGEKAKPSRPSIGESPARPPH